MAIWLNERDIWEEKPKELPKPASNRYGERLLFAYLPGFDRDIVSETQPALIGNPYQLNWNPRSYLNSSTWLTGRRHYPVHELDGSQGMYFPGGMHKIMPPFTILYDYKRSSAGSGHIISVDGIFPAAGWSLYQSPSNFNVAVGHPTTGSGVFSISNVAATFETWNRVSFSWTGTAWSVCKNGAPFSNGTNTAPAVPSQGYMALDAAWNGSSWSSSASGNNSRGDIFVFRGAMDDPEACALHRNPYVCLT